MLRPLKAAIVSSTKPDSFSVSVWIATAMSSCSATDRQQSIAAGTATRFEPGQSREVRLVAYAGQRRVVGFNGKINGKL